MHRDPHHTANPARRILAQRGPVLRCKGWKQETILRMLENNLENAERPEDLVVYMSAAKAARNWEAFDRIVATLKDLGNDETMVVQSGKPIARFRTHARAARDHGQRRGGRPLDRRGNHLRNSNRPG